MKVLFTFGGLPHYYNKVLSLLNSVSNLEVVVVVPEKKGATIGKGVFQSKNAMSFKVIETGEQPSSIHGKAYMPHLSSILAAEKPDIFVTIWPYALGLNFDSSLRKVIKQLGIKLIYKDIPFNIPPFNKISHYYFTKDILDENATEKPKKTIIGFLKFLILSWLRRGHLQRMDAQVYYTEEAYDIIPSYGIKKEDIFMIYNSPDTDELLHYHTILSEENQFPLPENPNRILHVGRLVKWKRVDLLLHAVARLQSRLPSIELVIIGTGPEEEALKKLANDLGISAHVRFLGSIYDPKVLGSYFMSASLYVLAGMGGLSINEAMSYGRAVLCSVADGTEKKLVREGYNGRYFKNGDLEDLIVKIESLLLDQALLTQMGANSLSIIKDEINIHTVINGYVAAFNYVCPGKTPLTYTH